MNALNRRDFIKCMGLGAAAMSMPGCASLGLGSSKPPNVVLVITDDQGYGDMACHGNPWIKTPNIDKLHAESTRLTDFHVHPVCAPTRCGLMTGCHPLRCGVWSTGWGRSFPRADMPMLPEIFAANGYRTGIFGKWHLGDNYPFRPEDRGFQECVVHAGGGVGQTCDYWGNDYFDDTYWKNGEPHKYEGYCTDIFFDEALGFIERNRNQPFFCYLSTNAPHHPWRVPEKYAAMYRDNPKVPNPEFYGMITNLDENLGRLTNLLDRRGLADNTILIFMTDNGTCAGFYQKGSSFHGPTLGVSAHNPLNMVGYNAGMRGGKGHYFDGGHRVPFFIRWPAGGIASGRDISDLTAHIDVAPTLLNLCGLRWDANDRFDGVSLSRQIKGDRAAVPLRLIPILFKQSSRPPSKDSGVLLYGKWRYVFLRNGNQLISMEGHPFGHTLPDAEKCRPELVKTILSEYDRYWEELDPPNIPFNRMIIGSDTENPVPLTASDWALWSYKMKLPYMQETHIMEGLDSNGYFPLAVARSGNYRIGLRRWPNQVDVPITAAIPGGKAIKADEAALFIRNPGQKPGRGKVNVSKPVTSKDCVVAFDVDLEPGDIDVYSAFIDTKTAENKSVMHNRGAYFVNFTRT